MQLCLPPGTISQENKGLLYGTKKTHQPLCVQPNQEEYTLVYPVAIGSYYH